MSRLVDSQLTILLISAVFTVQMTGFNFYLFSPICTTVCVIVIIPKRQLALRQPA